MQEEQEEEEQDEEEQEEDHKEEQEEEERTLGTTAILEVVTLRHVLVMTRDLLQLVVGVLGLGEGREGGREGEGGGRLLGIVLLPTGVNQCLSSGAPVVMGGAGTGGRREREEGWERGKQLGKGLLDSLSDLVQTAGTVVVIGSGQRRRGLSPKIRSSKFRSLY